MDVSRSIGRKITLGVCLLAAWPALAQETCAEYPELSSCNTNPIGVCDAEAAAQYVIEDGSSNHWVVIAVADDPLYPEQCSYENDSDSMNPRMITAKDDTNNLQCALDFAAAGRTSEDMSAKITLQKGRYCIREQLVGLDFSGTIEGAGKGKTMLDFDNPALKDANGYLTGEGGFEHQWDVTKSVMDPNGDPIDLLDRVEFFGDQAQTTTARRYFDQSSGALMFANNRFDSRKLTIRDLHLNTSKGSRMYTQTIHGYTNVLARPLSMSSFVTDSTVVGGDSLSFGGRSDELYLKGCVVRAQLATNNNGGQPWYKLETGVDLTTLDPELCVVPISDPAEMESPLNPRNCSESSCEPYAYDLTNLPKIDTSFVRIIATARGNMNNGLYYLNTDRNNTIDSAISGDEVLSITQPIQADVLIKDSVLRGLGSVFVGSIIDFGYSPIVDGKIKVQNNQMGIFREDGATYGCGRLWERLSLSDSKLSLAGNTINGCQGALVSHGRTAYFEGRGIDGADNLSGASQQPVPGPSMIVIQNNKYKQGPVMAGVESAVASFFRAADWLNNMNVESLVGQVYPSLEVRIQNNMIATADYSSENINPYWMIPIALEGMVNARIKGNTIEGASATAIAIGQEPEYPGAYDVGTKIINNDLSGFNVVSCDDYPDYTAACSTGSAELDEAANAEIWLGPNTSDTRVVIPDSDSYTVGDLSGEDSGNRVR
ncbi:MAG: hypothetical protein V7720_07135 [Halioglobus sp.]